MQITARIDAETLLIDIARAGLASNNVREFARSALRIGDATAGELAASLRDLAWLLDHDVPEAVAFGVGAVARAVWPGPAPKTDRFDALLAGSPDRATARKVARASRAFPPPRVALRKLVAREEHGALAIALCRGWYQEQIVTGRAALSGSDLRGKAAKWGSRYAQSRASIVQRLRSAGVAVSERRAEHGRRVLVINGADAGSYPEWMSE